MRTSESFAFSTTGSVTSSHGIFEKVFSHYQGCQPVCQRIHTGSRIVVTLGIWPDYVESAVDEGRNDGMEGRMCES